MQVVNVSTTEVTALQFIMFTDDVDVHLGLSCFGNKVKVKFDGLYCGFIE